MEDQKENTFFKIARNFVVPSEILNYIPEESARYYQIIPLDFKDNLLTVGAINPGSLDVKEVIKFIGSHSNLEYNLVKLSEVDFERLIKQYGETQHVMQKTLTQLEEEGAEHADDISEITDIDQETLESQGQESPVVNMVNSIIRKAVEQKASDIHIEPRIGESSVRFRVDGVMKEILRLPKNVHSPVIARVKILSKLRLDERRRPQDGSFSLQIKKNRIDFRVATLPTSEGEKVVLRVLDRTVGIRDLTEVGFSQSDVDKIKKSLTLPYGLILVSGPTGSGKTTTLYSILNLLDRSTQNIVSLEDPVEYSMDGVFQSEIRPEIGYTFATGLRSILRCDPNTILVGEIRDAETAKLAVQAALTGHLVFSTIHTNNAAATIPRLIEFGVDKFLLAPTINMIIAQRLSRTLFEGKGTKVPLSPTMKKNIEGKLSTLSATAKKGLPPIENLYETQKSEVSAEGLEGRTAIAEVMEVTQPIRDLILEGRSDLDIFEKAQEEGMTNMQQDAIIKGLKGIIPISEINKISAKIFPDDIADDMYTRPSGDVVKEIDEIV